MLTWCDPTLVAEHREASAETKLLEQVRKGTAPAETMRAYGADVSFERRWRAEDAKLRTEKSTTAIVADFRKRVADGEIQLTGLRVEPVLATVREILPAAWSAMLAFNISRNTIRVRTSHFIDIACVRIIAGDGASPRSWEAGDTAHAARSVSATDLAPCLPLKEALVAWSEPALIEAVRASEGPFPADLLEEEELPYLGGARGHTSQFRKSMSDFSDTDRAQRARAWKRLEADFRRKIEREEIFLYGIPSGAENERPRERIPAFWAVDLELDFTRSVVSRWHRRFVSVRAANGLVPAGQAGDRASPTAPRADAPDVPEDVPRTSCGRASYKKLLEEGLLANLERIREQRAAQSMSWTLAAKIVLSWLGTKYPDLKAHGGLPSQGTARTRLPALYHQFTAAAGVRN